ncbi:MAG: glycoside hydrolase family 88 protein, partial [Melioribacteraceae bacterium]|nr:glycoside hydrolase family 88 protein [Melioribacteraceae bacterium]
MKLPRKFLIGLILAFVSNLTFAQLEELPIERISEQLHKKYEIFDGQWPKYTEDGKWIFRKEVNWFSGFIGGELWNMFEITGDEKMKNRAIAVADSLLDYAGIDYTHDMGFIFLPSVYRAYKFTGAKKYKDALILAAEMLAKRFNSKGNFIRAWGKLGTDDNEGTMIIDTMMNLKLLFIIAKITGNTDLYDIAYKHAITCMNQHVRQNFSSYHVVGFDPASGEVVKRYTHQGFEDESTWARGQAWGIYGFAIAYKFTGDQRFLKTSTEMAKYFIERLPEDFVPYWDLDLSGNDVLKDASAGAIAASGMYLLSELTPSKQNYVIFTETARKIAYSLITKYTFLNSNRETEEGLQIHCIYNYNRGNAIDESYPCGDYYFTEILLKYYNDLNGLSINPSQKRTRINLNKNWFYLEDNIRNYKDLQLSNSDWERIDLPHSWNKFDAFDQIPGYRRDASWYQKIIQLDEINIEKEYYLTFEGANLKTELFVNGKFVGEHIGGYVGFQFDITSILKNGKNEIFVRVDNSIDKYLIPSQQSDFFISGGINRDVYLDVIPAQNFSSLKISTPNVSEKSATLSLDLNVRHFTKGMTILAVLVDPNNIVVQEKEFAEVGTENSLSMDEVDNPDLWSTENPSLYTIKLQLKKDNNIIDEIEETFGFRWFEFEKNGPFYLNGKRVLLRGTHRHEDHAGFANAIPNEIHRQDIEMIKSMGANFIRLGHYPQDPEIYKACDELGILVWDELPWCRGGVGDAKWKANAKRLFAAMINQNYNHPSIILWSV